MSDEHPVGSARFSTSVNGETGLEVSIGGYRYPLHHSRRCVVCNSPSRFAIEEGLLLGRAYASIQRSLPELNRDPESPDFIGVDQMRHHCRRHMGQHAAISREMVETHRRQLGKAVDAAEGTLIDAYSAAFEVMRLGYERMVKNPESVEVPQLLAAIKLVSEMEKTEAANLNTEAQTQLISLLLTHVQRVLSESQFEQLTVAFKSDPLFIALASQLRQLPSAQNS